MNPLQIGRRRIRLSTLGALAAAQSEDVDFGLTRPIVPITLWQGSQVNKYDVQGQLTLAGQPVANATLRANQFTLPQPTGPDGSFSVQRDQTILDRTVLTIADAARANVGGSPATAQQQQALQSAEAAIETAYMIAFEEQPRLRQGATDVSLSGTLTFADGTTPVPPVALWDFLLRGTLQASDGQPVVGAVVSISDDEGETWALSTRTDETGAYVLRFFPGEDARFTVEAAVGEALYEAETPVQFVPDTSAQLDLVLPPEGLTLLGTGVDGAMEPVAVDGAEYVGVLTGPASADGPIPASVTWPDAESGRFTMTIPSVDKAESITFYQAEPRFFTAEQVSPGTRIPADVLPTALSPNMPRDLSPIPVEST